MKICVIEGCEKKRHYRLHCAMHFNRIKRKGSAGGADFIRDPNRSITERVYSQLKAQGDSIEWDCWEWQGALRRGYGSVRVNGRLIYVHRWVYEHMIGEIPEDLVLDHTCLNRKCANPYHLDPVSFAENLARGGHWSGMRRVVAA